MSSLATSSPVSASTLAYLMRWPVFLLIWLKETFSDSEVAGYSATGQVTRDSRRKPFQLARGAMGHSILNGRQTTRITPGRAQTSTPDRDSPNAVNRRDGQGGRPERTEHHQAFGVACER